MWARCVRSPFRALLRHSWLAQSACDHDQSERGVFCGALSPSLEDHYNRKPMAYQPRAPLACSLAAAFASSRFACTRLCCAFMLRACLWTCGCRLASAGPKEHARKSQVCALLCGQHHEHTPRCGFEASDDARSWADLLLCGRGRPGRSQVAGTSPNTYVGRSCSARADISQRATLPTSPANFVTADARGSLVQGARSTHLQRCTLEGSKGPPPSAEPQLAALCATRCVHMSVPVRMRSPLDEIGENNLRMREVTYHQQTHP